MKILHLSTIVAGRCVSPPCRLIVIQYIYIYIHVRVYEYSYICQNTNKFHQLDSDVPLSGLIGFDELIKGIYSLLGIVKLFLG